MKMFNQAQWEILAHQITKIFFHSGILKVNFFARFDLIGPLSPVLSARLFRLFQRGVPFCETWISARAFLSKKPISNLSIAESDL